MKSPLYKKIIKNRILLILFAVFLALVFFLPSVINRQPQIQTKLLITALGIDKTEDGQIELSGIAVMPQSGDTATVKSITVEHKANNIGENLEAISEIYGKEAELGLCGLIVLGNNTVDKNILPQMEFLLSSAFVSPGTYVINSSNSSAKEILTLASSLDQSSAEILSSVVDFNANSCNITTITLLEFVSEHSSVSSASVIPAVRLEKSEEQSSNSSQAQGGLASDSGSGKEKSGEQDSKKTAVHSLKNTSLYHEGIKKGEFDEHETVAYNFTRKENMQGLFVLDDFVLDGENQGSILCSVYAKSSSHKVYFENESPVVEYDVKLTLQFLDQHKIIRKWEQNGRNEKKVIEPVIKQFEEKVINDLTKAIKKSIELNADVFQIENAFYRTKFKQYKEYKEKHADVLSNLQIKINPKIEFK